MIDKTKRATLHSSMETFKIVNKSHDFFRFFTKLCKRRALVKIKNASKHYTLLNCVTDTTPKLLEQGKYGSKNNPDNHFWRQYRPGLSSPGMPGAPPDFGRSVNPYLILEGQIMPTTLLLAPPDFQTFLRPCRQYTVHHGLLRHSTVIDFTHMAK